MIIRPTARLLVLDPGGRLLLFRCRETSGHGYFWIAPGGGVEKGESYERAALRELREETGIDTTASVEPCAHEHEGIGRHTDFGDRDIVFQDRYFPIHLTGDEVARLDPSAVTAAGYVEFRWWSQDQIDSTQERIVPEGLATIIRSIQRRS